MGQIESQQKMNNIQQEVGMSKRGWIRKSTRDEYPTGGGYVKKGVDQTESQQKMNIQQEVHGSCQKRGGSESQQTMNIQQEVHGSCQIRGGLGMIQPGRHDYQLSLLQY